MNHSRSVDREKADHNLTAFLDWLAQHRGVSERTVSQYRRHIAELLVELGSDPCCYDGVVIRSTILRHLETKPRSHVQHIVSSLRMYLRYLELAGLCTSGLVHAVPTIPTQSLSMLPRYVSEDDIERIIESCDVTTSNGLRDKAILLLLARSERSRCWKIEETDELAFTSGGWRCSEGLHPACPPARERGESVLAQLGATSSAN